MHYFWLSFVDPDTNTSRGCVVVDCETASPKRAVDLAHERGCNPDGRVKVVELPEKIINEFRRRAVPFNTLMQKSQMEELQIVERVYH